MKTFIYYSLPGYGHINPTLNVARELVKKGHKVLYYSTERFRPLIEEAGVTFRDYNFGREIDGNISRNVGLFLDQIAQIAKEKLPDILLEAEKEQPDCIMHDCMSVWGKIIAHKLDVPAVSLITTVAFRKRTFLLFPSLYFQFIKKSFRSGRHYIHALTTYSSLAKENGVKLNDVVDIVISKEKLNIVFSSPSYHPFVKSFDRTFHFVGPSISKRGEKDNFLKHIAKNKKIIYISYGTVLNDDYSFFKTCIQAFKNTPYQVIISLGDRFNPSDFRHIPSNILIKKYVNQLEVLQKASVFVTHAGMNSTTESMYYGVPMVLIPETEEQTFNALSVQRAGAGIYLKRKNFTKQSLLDAVEYTLNAPHFPEKCASIQQSLRKAGGSREASQKILLYLQSYS